VGVIVTTYVGLLCTHDHELDLQLRQPGGQGAAVALEAAEFPTVFDYRAVGLLDENRD